MDTHEYVTEKGLTSEANYPFCSGDKKCPGNTTHQHKNGVCDPAKEKQAVATFAGGYQVSGGLKANKHCDWCDPQPINETQMARHIVMAGPLTIGINSWAFDYYKKGIMNPLICSASINKLDHQVAIVGFGRDGGVDYWKVRNSWGKSWGEDGYVRIKRGKNVCGVASDASHVVAAPI